MRALAIIPAFNEADIIGWSVRHLVEQGLAVHVIDCESTDDTVRIARHAGGAVERYPVKDGRVSWRRILQHAEELANDSSRFHHWIMLQDADEIRRSPLSGECLLSAFDRMHFDGYNVAEFIVRTYRPIDNGYDGSQDPENYFGQWEVDDFNCRIGQQKAWKNEGGVHFAWSGGHRLRADHELRPHPLKLISKHYPIRNQAHGERKVFKERRGRWSDPEKDWHVQYADVQPGHDFLVKQK